MNWKKLLTIFSLIGAAATTQAQSIDNHRSGNDGEMRTLMGRSRGVGAYVGISTKIGELNGQYGLFGGGEIGLIAGSRLGIGIAGYGLLTDVRSPLRDEVVPHDQFYYQMGYGGLFIEPIVFPKRIFHFTTPILIGAGAVAETPYRLYESDGIESLPAEDVEAVMVVEPGVSLQVNVARWLRVDVGGTYRWMSNANNSSSLTNELSGFTGQLKLKVGWF